jgi:hypothetical protein
MREHDGDHGFGQEHEGCDNAGRQRTPALPPNAIVARCGDHVEDNAETSENSERWHSYFGRKRLVERWEA